MHLSMEYAASQGEPLALLDMAENVLPRGTFADPEKSLTYAQEIENSLREMTYDRAMLLGRLYAEADLSRDGWMDEGYQNLSNVQRSMAFFELARRIMPAPNMPNSEDCDVMNALLHQLHVGLSTYDQQQIETTAEQLYRQWF